MLQPIDKDLSAKNGEAVRGQGPEALLLPAVLLHGLQDYYQQQSEQVESLSYIRT